MFRLVRNRDPSCARVSRTMKRLWCSGVVPSLNPEPAVSKASEATAVQVRALPASLSSGVASSHGRSHRFDPCHAHQPKRFPASSVRVVCQKICQRSRVWQGRSGMQGVKPCRTWLSFRVLDHAAGPVPRVGAIGSPSLAASSGGPPPAARPRGCPGRSRLLTGR
jgi:hypothetical protein